MRNTSSRLIQMLHDMFLKTRFSLRACGGQRFRNSSSSFQSPSGQTTVWLKVMLSVPPVCKRSEWGGNIGRCCICFDICVFVVWSHSSSFYFLCSDCFTCCSVKRVSLSAAALAAPTAVLYNLKKLKRLSTCCQARLVLHSAFLVRCCVSI